jgi:hypothetical protein
MAGPSSRVSLLGKFSDSDEIKEWLKTIGAPQPKLPKGERTAHAEAKQAGIDAIFRDEASATGNGALAIGEGGLVLTNITFFAIEKGYDRYHGELPFGVNFEMSRDQVRALLGNPEFSKDRLRLDRWRLEDKWVFAKYAPDFGSIESYAVQIPDPS